MTLQYTEKVYITAEELIYDRNISVIAAQGSVGISTQQKVLLADSVSYHAKQDILLATGNVMLLDSKGHVAFADYVKIKGNLKEGFAQKIKFILSDNSIFTSIYAIYNNEKIMLNKASFNLCMICTRHKHLRPLWQIRAEKVTYDVEKQHIEYHGAWLEMWGIPIMYTPYLSHPGPSVKRRSGFLIPTLESTHHRGLTIRIPYFWALSPHSDLTMEAIFSHKETPLFTAEYRAALDAGGTANALSITRDKYGNIHGYILSNTIYKIKNSYRIQLKINRATDRTHPHHHSSGATRLLVSHATLEGFGRRSYGAFNAYSFQWLQQAQNAPFVFPSVVYSYIGHAVWLGYPALDANLMILHRKKEPQFSVMGSWIVPYTGGNGHIWTFCTRVHWLGTPTFPYASLFLPEAVAEWRYPLVRYGAPPDHIVIEPRLLFTLHAPSRSAPQTPHTGFHNDLFSIKPLVTLLSIAKGPQLSYGLKINKHNKIGQIILTLEQNYFFYSNMFQHFSDISGQLELLSTGYLSFLYRFRLKSNDLRICSNELNMNAGPKALQLGIDYAFIDRRSIAQKILQDAHHEVAVNLTSAVTRYLTFKLSGRYKLHAKKRFLSGAISAQYEDECFIFRGIVRRQHTRDRIFRASLSVVLEFSFKALAASPS